MRLGIPKNIQDYELKVIDGIQVYLPPDFDPPFALTINIHSLFGFKTLNVDGWKVI
ncbi:MAG: hypothetical protein P4N41_17725 [Negativicutes bacterium]|nr:hypothetical protein [Negativicutes bacterium]